MEARQVLCAGPGRLCPRSAWRLSLGVESKAHVDSGFRWLSFPSPVPLPPMEAAAAAWVLSAWGATRRLPASVPEHGCPTGPCKLGTQADTGSKDRLLLLLLEARVQRCSKGTPLSHPGPRGHEPVRLLLAPPLAPRPSTFVPAASLETCASALPSQHGWLGGPRDSCLGILF